MPIMAIGWPPRCASSATTDSASCMSAQRSEVTWSASATPRSTERMSNGFLRSPFVASAQISPSVVNSQFGPACGAVVTSRETGSVVGAGRGNRSPDSAQVCA
jgi:hypothetical protein